MNINMNKIKSILMQPDYLGQGLAQIPKVLISMTTTELGNKVINSLAGLIGNILNEWKMPSGQKKDILRAMFTNMMFTFADPTMNQIRELKRNVEDLQAGVKMGNYTTAFGGLIEEPETIVNTLRNMIPSMKGFNMGSIGKGFTKMLGGAKSPGRGFLSADKMVREIDTGTISKYSEGSAFAKQLDDRDIVDY